MRGMDDYGETEYTPRSFEEHFRPDSRSDYSDLIQKEKPVVKEEKKEENPRRAKTLWNCLRAEMIYPSLLVN